MNNTEYLVISRSNGTTKTGSPYATLKVANLIETINVAVWDMQPTAEPQVGQLVVFYNLKDNDGKKSCDFRDLKCCGEPLFDHELYNLLPRPIRRDIWDDKEAPQLLLGQDLDGHHRGICRAFLRAIQSVSCCHSHASRLSWRPLEPHTPNAQDAGGTLSLPALRGEGGTLHHRDTLPRLWQDERIQQNRRESGRHVPARPHIYRGTLAA